MNKSQKIANERNFAMMQLAGMRTNLREFCIRWKVSPDLLSRALGTFDQITEQINHKWEEERDVLTALQEKSSK